MGLLRALERICNESLERIFTLEKHISIGWRPLGSSNMTSSSKINGLYTVNRVLNSKTHYLETQWIFQIFWIFKQKFNYQFLGFYIRLWCKSHLLFMKNSNPRTNLARLWECLKIKKKGFFTLFSRFRRAFGARQNFFRISNLHKL